MEDAQKNNIDRMISIRSTEGDSYLDHHAGLISPQGDLVSTEDFAADVRPTMRQATVNRLLTRRQQCAV